MTKEELLSQIREGNVWGPSDETIWTKDNLWGVTARDGTTILKDVTFNEILNWYNKENQ